MRRVSDSKLVTLCASAISFSTEHFIAMLQNEKEADTFQLLPGIG